MITILVSSLKLKISVMALIQNNFSKLLIILPAILTLAIVQTFCIICANASSCESIPKHKINVLLALNNDNIKATCKYITFPAFVIDKQIKDNKLDWKSSCPSKEISPSLKEKEKPRNPIDEGTAKEKIKAEILRKLGLSKPPNVIPSRAFETRNHVMIRNLIKPYISRNGDNNEIPMYKYIVLFPAKVEKVPWTQEALISMLFQTNSLIIKNDIATADLWFLNGNFNHKFNWLNLTVNKFRAARRKYLPISSNIMVEGGEWARISLKKQIKKWAITEVHRLEIICTSCNQRIRSLNSTLNPFILIKTKVHPVNRNAADVNLVRNFNVFKEIKWPITIDFKSFEWNNWIVWPKCFNTHYCKGSCISCTDRICKNYIGVAKILSNSSLLDLSRICPNPIRTSSLEIIYLETPDIAVYTILHDIQVEECACG